MPPATSGTGHARVEQIIALAADYLGVEWESIHGRRRDQHIVEARHLLCYLLDRAGYTRAAIGRLLGRDHSTIIHAIGRVERSEALADEGWWLVRAVLPFVGEGGGPPAPGAVPLRADYACRGGYGLTNRAGRRQTAPGRVARA